MIINHTHRLCFFAIPRTGSKAIGKLLIEKLGSESVGRMHSGYAEFEQMKDKRSADYFSFAAVRNPMDSVVSAYFKKKSDHNGRFSRGTFKEGRPIGARAMAEYRYIVEHNADFADYFLHFYHAPYSVPRHEYTLSQVDRILRFEQLADDFKALMQERGIELPDLPVFNQTSGRDRNFLAYYPEHTHERARQVFGRFMQQWGYRFPEEWGG